MTLDDVIAKLRMLDPNARCSNGEKILMASIMLGAADEAKITALGLNEHDVREIGDRLRRNGVWDAGGIDEPVDSTEFWMLAALAEGKMNRDWDDARQEWRYRLTSRGKIFVEDQIRRKSTKREPS